MIEVTKYDERTYLAIMDIKTFESYGLNADYIDGEKDSAEVAILLDEIMGIINESYGHFYAGECGVGIVVDKNLDKVSISIGDEDVNVDIIHEQLDRLELENGNSSGISDIKEVKVDDSLDYTQGIIAEFNGFEEVIEFSKEFYFDKEDNLTLYEDEENKNIYYININKTAKLNGLLNESISDNDEDDVIEAIEYEIGKEIFNEYEMLKSYLEENGKLSNEKIGYLEEYCSLMISDNAVEEIRKHFK